MNKKTTGLFLRGLFAALMLSAVLAANAGAAPAWKFEEKALTGTESEVILGGAEKSGMTITGMLTTCDNFLYNITINNKEGTGEGKLTEMPLFTCYTDGVCTVQSIAAEALPWTANLTTVKSTNYIVIKGVKVGVLYGNEECVLDGILVTVKGTAGGSINNTTETATFDKTSFTETGTKLESSGSKVEWTGVFPTEAFQGRRNQRLTVS